MPRCVPSDILTLSGTQPDFSGYAERDYNTIPEFYGYVDAVKVPLSKMEANSFS